MNEIFLSASVPLIGRGRYHETSNPFLIQCAVRELFIAVIRSYRIIWGGYPAITPMVWSICEDLGVNYADQVVLYQSGFFEDRFPEENKQFQNVEIIPAVKDDKELSLLQMREAMLSRPKLQAAVFVGGMEGVEREHGIFTAFHPNAQIISVASSGGAARDLAQKLAVRKEDQYWGVDYSGFFHHRFNPIDDLSSPTTA